MSCLALTVGSTALHAQDAFQFSYQAQDFGAPLGTVIRLEGEQQTAWQTLRVGAGVEAALAHDMQGDTTVKDPGGCAVVVLFAEDEPHRFQNVTIRARVGNPLDKTCSDRATDDGEFAEIGTLKEPGRTFALVVVNRF